MFFYYTKAYKSGKGESQRLLFKALEYYAKDSERFSPKTELEVKKGPKGKPYVDIPGVSFSISHSGSIWACLITVDEVGLDVQEIRPASYEALAHRFFSHEEAEAVDREGSLAFFKSWVRKEAYGKYLGTGLTDDILRCDPIQREPGLVFPEIDIGPEVVAFCCVKEKRKICKKIILG